MEKIYFFEGFARLKNAIGITSHFCEEVTASNPDEARLKLYDKYEHISIHTVNEWEKK